MLTLLLTILFLVFLYGYFNDRKLVQLPPEAARIFSPARVTPEAACTASRAFAKNPIFTKNFLPPKTGRRYIVVGGAGFLGGWIVLQLLERGEDPRKIRVLDIRPTSRQDLRSGAAQHVSFLQVDISDAAAVSEAFKAPWPDAEGEEETTVFHTAANIRHYERHIRLLHRSNKVNHTGTINVIDASKEIGANTLVFTSSASVSVRRSRFWLWPWETRPPYYVQVYNDDDRHVQKQHDHFCSNYVVSKIAAEMAVRGADKSTTTKSNKLRTGCIRPGNGIFGPGGDWICEASLVRKTNPTWMTRVLQSFTFVENCALSHLCYEQRLIELEGGSTNPDIGGQAFTVTDTGPPMTYGDLYTALSALDKETVFLYVSPTLMLALAHCLEFYHVSQSLLSLSDSYIGRAIGRMLPTISGGICTLQPSSFGSAMVHLIFDDSRARLPPAKGGLGYYGPYTTLEGVCKTADEYRKSRQNGEKHSIAAEVSAGKISKGTEEGLGGRPSVDALTALN